MSLLLGTSRVPCAPPAVVFAERNAGLNLPYPTRYFAMEFSFAWLWVLIEVPRLFLGAHRMAGSPKHGVGGKQAAGCTAAVRALTLS